MRLLGFSNWPVDVSSWTCDCLQELLQTLVAFEARANSSSTTEQRLQDIKYKFKVCSALRCTGVKRYLHCILFLISGPVAYATNKPNPGSLRNGACIDVQQRREDSREKSAMVGLKLLGQGF